MGIYIQKNGTRSPVGGGYKLSAAYTVAILGKRGIWFTTGTNAG